jgi:two-component system nitrogen regulation sensor histidine kinase NtrY
MALPQTIADRSAHTPADSPPMGMSAPEPPQPPQEGRKPFRDNTKLILFGIAGLVAALATLLALASRSSELAPDFLTEFVLYALSATNLMMLVALVFVLARNIIKLVVERRRALPFSRFRAKLVAAVLGMTLIPAVLVLIVGSELISNSVDRWFNAPMDEVLSSASGIASDYYDEQQRRVSTQAQRAARSLAGIDLVNADARFVRDIVAPEVSQERIHAIEVYRVAKGDDGAPRVVAVTSVASRLVPAEYVNRPADRLAVRVAMSGTEARDIEQLSNQGEMIRTAMPIRSSPGGAVRGVVVGGG